MIKPALSRQIISDSDDFTTKLQHAAQLDQELPPFIIDLLKQSIGLINNLKTENESSFNELKNAKLLYEKAVALNQDYQKEREIQIEELNKRNLDLERAVSEIESSEYKLASLEKQTSIFQQKISHLKKLTIKESPKSNTLAGFSTRKNSEKIFPTANINTIENENGVADSLKEKDLIIANLKESLAIAVKQSGEFSQLKAELEEAKIDVVNFKLQLSTINQDLAAKEAENRILMEDLEKKETEIKHLKRISISIAHNRVAEEGLTSLTSRNERRPLHMQSESVEYLNKYNEEIAESSNEKRSESNSSSNEPAKINLENVDEGNNDYKSSMIVNENVKATFVDLIYDNNQDNKESVSEAINQTPSFIVTEEEPLPKNNNGGIIPVLPSPSIVKLSSKIEEMPPNMAQKVRDFFKLPLQQLSDKKKANQVMTLSSINTENKSLPSIQEVNNSKINETENHTKLKAYKTHKLQFINVQKAKKVHKFRESTNSIASTLSQKLITQKPKTMNKLKPIANSIAIKINQRYKQIKLFSSSINSQLNKQKSFILKISPTASNSLFTKQESKSTKVQLKKIAEYNRKYSILKNKSINCIRPEIINTCHISNIYSIQYRHNAKTQGKQLQSINIAQSIQSTLEEIPDLKSSFAKYLSEGYQRLPVAKEFFLLLTHSFIHKYTDNNIEIDDIQKLCEESPPQEWIFTLQNIFSSANQSQKQIERVHSFGCIQESEFTKYKEQDNNQFISNHKKVRKVYKQIHTIDILLGSGKKDNYQDGANNSIMSPRRDNLNCSAYSKASINIVKEESKLLSSNIVPPMAEEKKCTVSQLQDKRVSLADTISFNPLKMIAESARFESQMLSQSEILPRSINGKLRKEIISHVWVSKYKLDKEYFNK